MLAAAQRQAAEDGALVGLLRTSIPHFFRRAGWALCGQPSSSQAATRTVLARLLDEGLRWHRHRPHRRLHIRPWRRWEERALVRIYRQNLAGRYGSLDRTLAYWQWLLRRQAFDQIYVALDGPDLWDLEEVSTAAVGYVVLKGHRVVELVTVPGRPKVAAELLAHACGDAIEHDQHSIVLHAPPDSPFHQVFAPSEGPRVGERAGPHAPQGCGLPRRGEQEGERGEVYMARLLQPKLLLERLCGEFCLRARQARLPRPLELGLQVEGQKYQVELSNCVAAVTRHRMGRSYLRMNVADFTRLVLGQLDWDRAVAEKRLEVSTALAQQAGRASVSPPAAVVSAAGRVDGVTGSLWLTHKSGQSPPMNYFAHALPFLEEPYFVAGTAVPDWLSVVDRGVRVRRRHAEPFAQAAGAPLAAVARGLIQHLRDDARFHESRTFAESSLELSGATRQVLGQDPGFRPSFLGHLLVEVLLDASLAARDAGRVELFYRTLEAVGPRGSKRQSTAWPRGPPTGWRR